MPNRYDKYRTGKGYKPIVKKKKEKFVTPEGGFDYGAQENWLFADDEEYKRKRKRKKKKKNK
jgi:hypothetical protein